MEYVRTSVSPAGADRLNSLVPVFARAFSTDPMMQWSITGTQEREELLTLCFTYFLEIALELGVVWEAAVAKGSAVWFPPGASDAWVEHPWNQRRILELSDDGGERYDQFWSWIDLHIPDEPLWLLDSIAVDPMFQGRGYGMALIDAGLSQAARAGCGAFLATGTERNVSIYSNCGFRIADHADAPGGGPHIWFMRWDP